MDILKIRLSEEITNSKMSQKEIASKMQLSTAIISEYKNKKKIPDVYNLAKLAKILNISTDYLLGLEDEFGNKENYQTNLEFHSYDQSKQTISFNRK